MKINGAPIEDTHAECFEMHFARLVITGRSGKWVSEAAQAAVGCATSIIGCGCEAGLEALEDSFNTPDGRPGQRLLFFAKTRESLEKELIKRVGQVLLPTPTITVFNGVHENGEGIGFELGKKIGFFGNGFQRDEDKYGRKCVVVPITSGEFICEKTVGIASGVGGANFWIYAESHKAGLRAAEKAVDAIREIPGLITPFVGGVVGAASKIGSVYPFLTASTQEDFCPTVPAKKNPDRKLPDNVKAVFEIVIDAISPEIAKRAMRDGINAACVGGIKKIGAANFNGKLGKINIPLRELFSE